MPRSWTEDLVKIRKSAFWDLNKLLKVTYELCMLPKGPAFTVLQKLDMQLT